MNEIVIRSFNPAINISKGLIYYLGKERVTFYSKYGNPNHNINNLYWDTDANWQGYGQNPTLEILIHNIYFFRPKTFAFKTPKSSCYQKKFLIYGIDKYNKQYNIGNYESAKYNFCSSSSSSPQYCPDRVFVQIPALNNKNILYKKFIIQATQGSCQNNIHIAFAGIELFGSLCIYGFTYKLSSQNAIISIICMSFVICS